MAEQASYPQYRKYPNEKAFFKIISDKEWEEIQVTGKNYTLHSFVVKILPDRNYLYDLTFDYSAYYEKITEEEYEEVRGKVNA